MTGSDDQGIRGVVDRFGELSFAGGFEAPELAFPPGIEGRKLLSSRFCSAFSDNRFSRDAAMPTYRISGLSDHTFVWAHRFRRVLLTLGLLLTFSSALADSVLTLRTERLTGSADGEDGPHALYYSHRESDFQLTAPSAAAKPSSNDLRFTRITVFNPDAEEGEGEAAFPELRLPKNSHIDIEQVRGSEDGSILLFQMVTRPDPLWLFVDAKNGQELARLTRDRLKVQADGTASVVNPPAALAKAIKAIVPLPLWQKLIWAEHLGRIQDAGYIAEELLNTPAAAHFDPEAVALARQLLSAKPIDVAPEMLIGDWRLRSLQVDTLGAYLYPFFKASVERRGDLLLLKKTSGSQRRQGVLYPAGQGEMGMIMLGGLTMNDTPLQGYSRGFAKIDSPAPAETDTVGVVRVLSRQRIVVLIDAQWGRGFELYELVRP